MLLLTVTQQSLDDEKDFRVQSFIFEDKPEFEIFLKNNIEHSMNSFGRCLGITFNVTMSLAYVDCKCEEWNTSKVIHLIPIFATNDTKRELESNYTMQGFDQSFSLRTKDNVFIPTSCKTLFKRIKQAVDLINQGF